MSNRVLSIDEKSALRLQRAMWRGVGRSFRGEIYDYCRTIELTGGYLVPKDNLCRNCREKGINRCKHFEIDTCRQLVGAFKALNDPNISRVMILKAVQTLGSLVWELTLHFLIVHSPYKRIKIFIDSIEKADRFADDRFMPILKSNKDIAPLIPREGMARHDAYKTGIKFLNGKTIEILALNESNASSLSADFVVIDEGWEHGADGLMQKAIDRTKQAKATGNCKVLIVGQAGNVKEDQDNIWLELHKRVRATWQCPCCGGRQTFGEQAPSVFRKEDFKPLPPLENLPAGMIIPTEPPVSGTYAGLKVRGDYRDVSKPEEIKALAATAFLECYHCGYKITDTPKNRRALVDSFDQEHREVGVGGILYTPKNFTVGFWNPDPASETIPFAGTMEEYIKAKKADDDFKNKIRLRDFYQNRWATAWNEKLGVTLRVRAQEKYDIQSDWPEEWKGRRSLIIDCQHELQHFWASVFAISETGKSRQLWRGLVRGFGDPNKAAMWTPEKNETPMLVDVQKHFGVLDQRTFLDGGYMREELVEECAKHGHWGKIDGERTWLCWNLLIGSASKDFSHFEDKNPKNRYPVSDVFKETPKFRVDGNRVDVEVFYFAKTAMSTMAARYRDGNGPQTMFLAETESPENPLSWTAQIYSCTPHYEISKKTGEASEIWKADKQSTPTHFWDVLTMFMAVHCLWGIGGFRESGRPDAVVTNP